MKRTKKMQEFVKNYELGEFMQGVCNFYNDFACEFGLNIGFDTTDNGYDTDIICSIYSEKIKKSIIITWQCKEYRDLTLYNDPIDYLLELEQEAEDILEIL